MRIKPRHHCRQLGQGKAVLRVINAQAEPLLHELIQRLRIRQMDLLLHMTILPVGKIKVGQRQLAAVRQVAAHQQVMTKMGLRPVRRPEISHHIIVEVLGRQVKMVHRLPVLVMAELQYPVVTLAQQTINPVRGFLLLVGDQTNRRRQRLSAKSHIGDPAFAVQLHQQ